MNISVANQRILILKEQFTQKEAEGKAFEKKLDAFGALNKLTSFLSKPKDDDFELVYKEHRYQPFWHVACKARYVYDRNSNYQIATTGAEVQSVTMLKSDFEATNNHIHVSVVEHCKQEMQEEAIVGGVSGEKRPAYTRYLTQQVKEVKDKTIDSEVAKGAILVPPQVRVSALMREMLSHMIKGIQADKIFEEHVEVTYVDLYYRPVFAFKYKWKSKGKEAIVEVDGVTGEVTSGNRTFQEYVGKVLDRDFLFDVGADAAGMFIPGGSIAVKVAKKVIDRKK